MFIGHEGFNFKRIAESLSVSTPKIFYSTTAYWQFLNSAEATRLNDLQNRRGAVLVGERQILADENEVLLKDVTVSVFDAYSNVFIKSANFILKILVISSCKYTHSN